MEDAVAYQWKMSLNPDRPKQAHEVTFLEKCSKIIYRSLYFDNITVNEWNKFDSNIRSYYLEYCNVLLKFIGPVERKIFNVNNYNGLKKFIGI